MAELTLDEAKAVYEVLVEECGAPSFDQSPSSRRDFIATVTRGGFQEYRFMGALGFGGKFWDSHHRWYVTCYRENVTADREEMIDRANDRLADLYERFKGEPPRW